jgi:hypothetical protein
MFNRSRKNPEVKEVRLKKQYKFMYENFLISTQHALYLLLEKEGDQVHALKFGLSCFKYGYPNDEVHGNHPMTKYGLGLYGLYEVSGSPWIEEMMVANRIHHRHTDSMFSDKRHFIACFKDVTLDVVCTDIEEIQLTRSEVIDLLNGELASLEA